MRPPRQHTLLGWAVLALVVGIVAALVLTVVVSCSLGVRWYPPETGRHRDGGLCLGPCWIAPAAAAELRPGELELLARVVAAEARGESLPGQRAIAWTVVNRLEEPETYGRTVTRVLLRPYQYAKPLAVGDAHPAYLRAMLASVQVLLGEVADDSHGATHFCRCDLRPLPAWARQFELRTRISGHCFYREAD